ncbi:MAG: TetR/AcrR family transcriptional regulator, partial [Ignavibacteriaceae bacterium]|nr:TetR/AcrR family transcriptional regulator [Ignavibacteriaceae bacterium]
MRNKEETKQKLLDAVSKIILRDGFKSVGINTIAKEAGVDKVLIYRYFGSLEGLLKIYISQKDYFGNLKEFIGGPEEIKTTDQAIEAAKKVFIGQLRSIRKNKELQEILLWELNNRNKITVSVARKREAVSMYFVKAIEKNISFEKSDIRAILSIFSSSIYYMVLRAKTV